MDIRTHFPALERLHNGRPVAYFDAPGGTQVPRVVAEAMTDYLFHHNANTHWAYPTSRETDVIITSAREACADLVGGSPQEIVFGANMTTLTFHFARALGAGWKAGDEVIVTELDHQANVAPWKVLERERGIVVRTARMDVGTVQLDWTHLEQLAGPRTRLIALGGASNAVGTMNDIARASVLARSVGALLFVDGVHLAPHALIDVQALGCDAFACSSYKFYGPHAGILWARRELLQSLPFAKLDPAPDSAPERAETGTQNHEAIAGIAATVDFLASLGEGDGRRRRLEAAYAWIASHEKELGRRLWNGLSAIPSIRLHGCGPDQKRTATVAFSVDGRDAGEVAQSLADRALFVSHGDFYAPSVIRAFGLDSVVRVGCAIYSTEEEVDRLLDALSG